MNIVKNVDEKTIRRLAQEYVNGSYVSFQRLGEKYGMTPKIISNILWRGVAENIIDSLTANRLYIKVVARPSKGWYQRTLRWDEAFDKRAAHVKATAKDAAKERALVMLKEQKDYYESAIANYDSYFINEDNALSLETLQTKLDEINRKIATYS